MTEKTKSSHSILIVESDSNLRKGIAQGFISYGLEVSSTGNPFEAVQWLHRQTYDIILTGMEFSIMDGQYVLERMREAAPEIPILLMAVQKEAIGTLPENTHWIEKPVDMEAIMQYINTLLCID